MHLPGAPLCLHQQCAHITSTGTQRTAHKVNPQPPNTHPPLVDLHTLQHTNTESQPYKPSTPLPGRAQPRTAELLAAVPCALNVTISRQLVAQGAAAPDATPSCCHHSSQLVILCSLPSSSLTAPTLPIPTPTHCIRCPQHQCNLNHSIPTAARTRRPHAAAAGCGALVAAVSAAAAAVTAVGQGGVSAV